MNSSRTVLGFDYGTERMGCAVGQEISGSAEPLVTLKLHGAEPDWQQVQALIDTWQPDLFVVGLPTHADGATHPLEARIRKFARRLEGRFARPVEFIDERLSSYSASENTVAVKRFGLDAVAASVIIETWMSHHKATEVLS